MAALVALVAGSTSGATGAAAAPPGPPAGGAQVVTLGDSYASGEGAPSPVGAPWTVDALGDSGADGCHRSVLSGHAWFGFLAARGKPGRYVNASCSGATTADVVTGSRGEASQLSVLGPRTRTVTLSVGGNDAAFGTVATACQSVAQPDEARCRVALELAGQGLARLTTPAAGGVSPLEGLYRTVRERAPRAEVLVAGYPLLFPAADAASPVCDTVFGFAREELNRLALAANTAIAATAERAGAVYVDLAGPFTGHSSCEENPARSWINTLTPQDPVASFHPNRAGQRAIACALARASRTAPGRA
ncbi:SGNH/GDSL hydrolase family protein [Kineococcus sp. NUM-3379]